MKPVLGSDTLGSPYPRPASDGGVPPRTVSVPEIHWSTVTKKPGTDRVVWTSADLPTFPSRESIDARSRAVEGTFHLPVFKRHVQAAANRVFVADRYLLCGGEAAEREVLSWFPPSFEGRDVRIAFGGYADIERRKSFVQRLRDAQNRINAIRVQIGAPPVELKLKETLDSNRFPYLHDRFAVVDGELWHFGATVGGTHPGVTAASRGWDATATSADVFFNLLWNEPAATRSFRSACAGLGR